MAGETVAPIGSPPLAVAPLRCRQCGASLQIRAPGRSAVVVCGSCGSTLDARNAGHAVLKRSKKAREITPRIPLAARGTLDGIVWEVIGFLRRTDGSSAFVWDEYLLYNPWRGFRWLVEADGHWTLVRMLADRPFDRSDGALEHQGAVFKPFLSGTALVKYALGEFYWRVERGEQVSVSDFIAPPSVLSREMNDDEVVWSRGEYLRPETVSAAFGIEHPPLALGIAPAQPFPAGIRPLQLALVALFACGLLLFAQFAAATASARQALHDESLNAAALGPDAAPLVSQAFTVPAPTRNLEITVHAPVNNDWLYLDAALVNEETQETRQLDFEVSYYHGVDGGESWSEGSQQAAKYLDAIPPGIYHVELEPQLPSATQQRQFRLRIRRDVDIWRGFWLLAWPLLAAAAGCGLAGYAFEKRRWEQSDYPWGESSGWSDDE